MTQALSQDELQEEAGILSLACGQLGTELAQDRLVVAKDVLRRLGAIVRKLERLDAQAKLAAAPPSSKPNGHAEHAAEPAGTETKSA